MTLELDPHTLLIGSDDPCPIKPDEIKSVLRTLRSEDPCSSEVRVERGTPRLFINGEETLPFFALSTGMRQTATGYSEMGIQTLFPIVGLRNFWTGPQQYNWEALETYLAAILTQHQDAKLFLRMHLHTPPWWMKAHPDEAIRYGLPTPQERYNQLEKGRLYPLDGGHYMHTGAELNEVSMASEPWRRDTAAMLQSLVRFFEQSPLRSRVMGYFLMNGRSGEWNYFGGEFMPDYSDPMISSAGPIPKPRDRLFTTCGLLRDPERERGVIEFYERYHKVTPAAIDHLAGAIKEALARPLICGAFYGYLMEVPVIQDGGFLASRQLLECPHLDLIAGPYTYQNTNQDGVDPTGSDMEDGAGNWLGRARGVGGDGAHRMMVESIRRAGKLYATELDPSTSRDRENRWRAIGGSGSETEAGTIRLLSRDIGRIYAEGYAGWLYDFGPTHGVPQGWYGGKAITEVIGKMLKYLDERRHLEDLRSVAEVAFVGDESSFCATQHWMANRPFAGQGIEDLDLFNHWFFDAQNRSLQRLGAPIDFLYRQDLTREDLRNRYRLLLVPNAFLLEEAEVTALLEQLEGSGATVVWYYAPGLLRRSGIHPEQMGRLTGFSMSKILEPGPFMIRTRSEGDNLAGRFGVKSGQCYSPRFAVDEGDEEILGWWEDCERVAFARKQRSGWTSVYVGTAPLPTDWLRSLAADAGVRLWSSQPDVVAATASTAMVVATSAGTRDLELPVAMEDLESGRTGASHPLDLEFGEVRLFRRLPSYRRPQVVAG